MKIKLVIIPIAISMAVAPVVCSADTIQPVAMNNKTVGGGDMNQYTHGVSNGGGLNNIGLLIKTTGKVTFVDTTNKFFYIDDGSALKDGTKKTDGSAVIGVRVSYKDLATGNTFTAPSVNDRVAIVGISSTSQITVGTTTKIIPTIRPRRNADKTSL